MSPPRRESTNPVPGKVTRTPASHGRLGCCFPTPADIGQKAGAGGFRLVDRPIPGVAVPSDRGGGDEETRPRLCSRQCLGYGRHTVHSAVEHLASTSLGPAFVGDASAGEVHDPVHIGQGDRVQVSCSRFPLVPISPEAPVMATFTRSCAYRCVRLGQNSPSEDSKSPVSSRSFMVTRNRAASAPSTIRWS